MKKKTIIIIAAVVVIGLIGIATGQGNPDPEPETAKTEQTFGGGNEDVEPTKQAEENAKADEKADTEEEQEKTKQEVAHREGDNIVGVSDKDEADLNGYIQNTVRNDVTERWKCLVIAANNIDITQYALSCYEKYFDTDDTILAVENLTTKTAASITKVGDQLSVSVYEYVDGEEHDAKLMFSGTPLGSYIVYLDNGDIEKVTD